MKTIAIVLVFVLGFGSLGFVGTSIAVSRIQRANRTGAVGVGGALKDLQARQDRAFIGLGIGATVGLIGGLIVSSYLDRRSSARLPIR